MKQKTFIRVLEFRDIFNAIIATVFFFGLSSIALGQSSYTNVYVNGGEVVAYGSIIDSYMSGSHINTTSISISGPSGSASGSGGDSATVWLSIGSGGDFNAFTSHDAYCPVAAMTIPGIAASAGSISVPGQTSCTDTCTPCRALRQPKEENCLIGLGVCEAAAFIVYNNAMTQCENNNYCNPNHPAYNPEQCDNCTSTANTNYSVAIAACLGPWYVCRSLITPNCDELQYKKANCDQCDNWPPW